MKFGWLNQWFKEVRKWDPTDMEEEIVTWLRIFGIPCHAYGPNFFEFISKPFGVYICSDGSTRMQSKLDVARILVRTKCSMTLNETFNFKICGYYFPH